MDCLSTCALVFFCIATTQTGESVASEQTIFRRREQEYLADHVIETKQAGSELECGLHCLADTSCTSVNYKTSGIGKGRCELNDKTVEETPEVDDKIHHPEFNHLAVVERNPSHSDPKSTPLKSTVSPPTCSSTDWSESFKKEGWSKCAAHDLFITGFYRLNPPDNTSDPIYLLEQARCCNSTPEFSGQHGTCKSAFWYYSLDRDATWSSCPAGYFLNGLYLSGPNNLHNIDNGYCCKPSNHPDGYGSCYTEDVGESFEREGWTICSKLGYYITGVYRGFGNWLKNIDKFQCCQMLQ